MSPWFDFFTASTCAPASRVGRRAFEYTQIYHGKCGVRGEIQRYHNGQIRQSLSANRPVPVVPYRNATMEKAGELQRGCDNPRTGVFTVAGTGSAARRI